MAEAGRPRSLQEADTAEPSVVGTWRLVSYAREDTATGVATHPWGEKAVKLFETLAAYAGTYTTKGDSVVHHVEVCKAPDWVRTDQPRLFRLNGDTLSLRT